MAGESQGIMKRTGHWNVIYTKPRAEKKVFGRLAEQNIESYLPLYTTIRKWSDRRKKVELPLFNSYVFVRVTERKRREVLEVAGVVRFLYYLGKPAVIRQKEIDAIRRFLNQTEGCNIIVNVGEHVEIATGAMEGVYGKVIRIGKEKLLLQIEQLSTTIIAEVDRRKVRRRSGKNEDKENT